MISQAGPGIWREGQDIEGQDMKNGHRLQGRACSDEHVE